MARFGCFALALLITTQALATEPAATSLVEFEFVARQPGALGPWLGKLVLEPHKLGEARRVLEVNGSNLAVQLPAHSTWTLTPQIKDHWSPRLEIQADASDFIITYRVGLWPSGLVRGKLQRKSTNEPLPKSLDLDILTPSTPQRAVSPETPAGKSACEIDPEVGSFSCKAPRGLVDFALRPAEFTPSYSWQRQITSTHPLDLGSIPLVRGASLVAWVTVEGGEIQKSKCTARIFPAQAQGRPSETSSRISKAGSTQVVPPSGFIQFRDLPLGTYTLEVEQEGFSPATASPLGLWNPVEVGLPEPLVLRKPLSLRFTTEPNLDWLGRRWQMSIVRRAAEGIGGENVSVFEGATDREGVASVLNQPPGSYLVEISDSQGNRFASYPSVEIANAEQAEQTFSLEIIDIEGSVSLGDDPLPSTLWFGGRFGGERVKIETDENSRFRGVLPREGRWDVEVTAAGLRSSPRVRVIVEVGPSGKAEIDVSLPSTRVFGTVVDPTGVGKAGAVVEFASSTKVEQVQTDKNGEFELVAVQEGSLVLQAGLERNGKKWTTERKVIEVREGQDAGPVRLVLREGQTIEGRVRSKNGLVAGATVVARALGGIGGVDTARTDLEGTFSVELPTGFGLLSFLVSAPGYALQAFEAAAETPIDLVVTDRSGSLEIGATEIDGETEILLIFQGKSLLDTGTLTRWAQGHGQTLGGQEGLFVPRLAPALYSVCRVPFGALLQHGLGSAAVEAGSCNSGVLRADETLRLAVPSKAQREE